LPPGNYVCLSVRDQGEGMDDETLANATTPFYTTKGVGKGTGLGLPIARELAHALGGELVLESQLGKGSRFELRLPAG